MRAPAKLLADTHVDVRRRHSSNLPQNLALVLPDLLQLVLMGSIQLTRWQSYRLKVGITLPRGPFRQCMGNLNYKQPPDYSTDDTA